MIYFVTFETHIACKINDMIFHCEAKNANEAKEICKKFWHSLHGIKGHQFHLYAKKSNIQDAKYLRVRGWEGTEYTGEYVMNHVFCTDFRTWRVNGINQYGTNKGLYYKA
jgi:hypothetical protein